MWEDIQSLQGQAYGCTVWTTSLQNPAAEVRDAGQLLESLVFWLYASATGVLTAIKVRWHLQISMYLNPKALWMAISQENIPCRLWLQMILIYETHTLDKKWWVGGAFSSLSPRQFGRIHFVVQMLIPEPSAKLPISHSSCIPANTGKPRQCLLGPMSPSHPDWQTVFLTFQRVLSVLPGRDAGSGCPQERGQYSCHCSQHVSQATPWSTGGWSKGCLVPKNQWYNWESRKTCLLTVTAAVMCHAQDWTA